MLTFFKAVLGTHPETSSTSLSAKPQVRYWPYLLISIAASFSLWGIAFLYLKKAKPVYISSWTVSLPSTTNNTKINLPNAGTVLSDAESPYANKGQDPRENYKLIANSKEVLEVAASKLGMEPGKFGQPRVKVVDNTTLMTFELRGSSPDEAQKKSVALYDALRSRLNQLRIQEAIQREERLVGSLANSHRRLQEARRRLTDYQVQTGLVSTVQIEQLSNTIEDLQKKRAESFAFFAQSQARLNQLSSDLEVDSRQASDALILKSDPIFQQYLREYSTTKASLVGLRSRFSDENPVVIRAKDKLDIARTSMLERGRSLIKQPVDETSLAHLNVGGNDQSGTSREALFKDIVTSRVDQQGWQASVAALNQQITQLQAQRTALAKSGSTLEELKRDVQIAEAVFSSTLVNSDATQPKLGSFPDIQMLSAPSLPEAANSPKKSFIFLGSALGSVLLFAGFTSLFIYKRRTQASRDTIDDSTQINSHEAAKL